MWMCTRENHLPLHPLNTEGTVIQGDVKFTSNRPGSDEYQIYVMAPLSCTSFLSIKAQTIHIMAFSLNFA